LWSTWGRTLRRLVDEALLAMEQDLRKELKKLNSILEACSGVEVVKILYHLLLLVKNL
jgi:hypothetical protein